MSYDLSTFLRDIQGRLDWLFDEVDRLKEENERLLRENKALREEVTLARLFRDIEPAAEPVRSEAEELFEAPPSVSREVIQFYHRLPSSFNFADFFVTAEAQGVTSELAREYMLVFFRENMLLQRGTRIEKTGTLPYPKRLAR